MPSYICDDGCEYSERGAERLRGDPARCIRHGNILYPFYGHEKEADG